MQAFRDADQDFHMDIPREDAARIKEMARTHPEAIVFLIENLCGVHRSAYVMAEDAPISMAVRVGEQRVGLKLMRIINAPMSSETPPQPRARSATEKQRQRVTKTSTT